MEKPSENENTNDSHGASVDYDSLSKELLVLQTHLQEQNRSLVEAASMAKAMERMEC